jgi:hypothetical protein
MSKIADFLLDKLNEVAKRSANCDDEPGNVWGFNARDASGDNYDDAYSMGQDDGEILFARGLLKQVEELD